MKLPKTISDLPDIPMHQIISLLSDTEVVYFGKAMADVLDNEPGLWNNIFRRRWTLEDHNSETTEAVASQTGPKRMGMAGGRFSSNLEGY